MQRDTRNMFVQRQTKLLNTMYTHGLRCSNMRYEKELIHFQRWLCTLSKLYFPFFVKKSTLNRNTVDSRYLELAYRITAYLEVKILSLSKHENLTTSKNIVEKRRICS